MRIITSTRRGCGYKKQGGVYLVSEPGKMGVLPLFVRINPPIPCADNFYRGTTVVDGQKILDGSPEDEWLVGASAERKQKQTADEWAIEKFGMTTHMRCKTGICAKKGARSADEAMNVLLETVRYHPNLIRSIRQLSELRIDKIPKAAEPFALLVSALQMYLGKSQDSAELVKIVAAIWRLINVISPSKKQYYYPVLLGMLVFLNLSDDAIALKRRERL
jgi:hypothetical protein